MAAATSAPDGRVGKSRVRLNALFVFLFALAFITTPGKAVIFFLAADFFLRGFLQRWSPIAALSGLALRAMKVTDRPIHAAPKLFAAKIGFVFSVAIAVMWYTGAGAAAIAAASLLASFAALEAFAEICVGCWMYSLLQMLIRRGAVNPRPMAG